MQMSRFGHTFTNGNGFTTMANGLKEAKENVVNFMKKQDKNDKSELTYEKHGWYEKIEKAGEKGSFLEVREYYKGEVVVTEES